MTAIAPVITIDGPSGAGKGTLCKAMAEALQWHLLDSGAIYRVLALAALHHHVDVASEDALVPLASHLDVRFVSTNGNLEVILEGEDVSGEIRTQEVANAASQVAAFPRVREALLRRQRAFRELPGLIAAVPKWTAAIKSQVNPASTVNVWQKSPKHWVTILMARRSTIRFI